MQQSMFGDEKKTNTVLRVALQKKALTKNQQAFNRLTTRISNLRNEIESADVKLRHLSGLFNAEITPLIRELGIEKIALAKALDAGYKKLKLTQKQKE